MIVGTMRGSGGVPLRTLRWEATGPARGAASVVVVHGLGEHAGRYDHVGRTLAGDGWDVLAWDLRGHGKSGGRRGALESFGHLVEDLERAREEAARVFGREVPSFLLGHSMGGLVVIRYLQTRPSPAPGAVLSAPWLGTAAPIPWWKRTAVPVLRRVAPDLALPTGVDPSVLSRDPAAQRAYAEDPLVHDRVSARLFDEVRRAQDRAVDGGLPVPALLLVPGADRLADAGRTLAWAHRVGKGVEVVELDGLRHEPFHEPERDDVLARVARWMRRCLDVAT